MLLPFSSVGTWQVIRAVARAKRKPVLGINLRLAPSRITKDGSFLTDLVDKGLLAYATGNKRAPFDATYTLTAAGQYAAEYGEYEADKHGVAKAVEAPVKEPEAAVA